MEKLILIFFVFHLFLFLTGNSGVYGHEHHHERCGVEKLFVFGDSYADTGNYGKSFASSWKEPYGSTFPGKPTGRWSDGRVMTDFFASILGLRSPLPYRCRKLSSKLLKGGMNFAYAGAGVFDTFVPVPNLTTQISFLRNMISAGEFSEGDMKSSIALISIAGNDYAAFLAPNGSQQDAKPFTASVINRLALNIMQVQGIGIRKIAVTAISPLGCLPSLTAASSNQKCNQMLNQVAAFHNLLLKKAMDEINSNITTSNVALIDLYTAFSSILQRTQDQGINGKLENPLKPCCVGISSGYDCGSVASNGTKMYTVCDDPKSSFFWDIHPSQGGWALICPTFKATIDQLFSSRQDSSQNNLMDTNLLIERCKSAVCNSFTPHPFLTICNRS